VADLKTLTFVKTGISKKIMGEADTSTNRVHARVSREYIWRDKLINNISRRLDSSTEIWKTI